METEISSSTSLPKISNSSESGIHHHVEDILLLEVSLSNEIRTKVNRIINLFDDYTTLSRQAIHTFLLDAELTKPDHQSCSCLACTSHQEVMDLSLFYERFVRDNELTVSNVMSSEVPYYLFKKTHVFQYLVNLPSSIKELLSILKIALVLEIPMEFVLVYSRNRLALIDRVKKNMCAVDHDIELMSIANGYPYRVCRTLNRRICNCAQCSCKSYLSMDEDLFCDFCSAYCDFR